MSIGGGLKQFGQLSKIARQRRRPCPNPTHIAGLRPWSTAVTQVAMVAHSSLSVEGDRVQFRTGVAVVFISTVIIGSAAAAERRIQCSFDRMAGFNALDGKI